MKALPTPKSMADMTTRELLHLWTYLGFLANVKKADGVRIAPAKGPRGLKRRAKKARRAAHARRLQRVSWCSYGENVKRAQALIAKGGPS